MNKHHWIQNLTQNERMNTKILNFPPKEEDPLLWLESVPPVLTRCPHYWYFRSVVCYLSNIGFIFWFSSVYYLVFRWVFNTRMSVNTSWSGCALKTKYNLQLYMWNDNLKFLLEVQGIHLSAILNSSPDHGGIL